MNNNDGAINFRVGLDNSQLQADAAKANAQLRGIGNTATAEGSRMGDAFKSASGMIGIAAMAGVASIGILGKQILDTTAKFEKFGIVLKNTLGEAKGGESLAMLANFAATTPFQLDEVTGAFIKMANQGFVPTQAEMVKLGDLASSTGKSFDQLGEALLDAQTGQFERLKEFGIKASANGDKVTFSFKEQQTTVENTNSSIQAYILSLGELKGVAGANALISASLTGQMSNLGDKLAAMYNEIGTSNKGFLYSALGGVSSLIENYKLVGDTLTGLIAIYGTYKVAVMYIAYTETLAAAAKTKSIAVEAAYQVLLAQGNIQMAARARGITVEIAMQELRARAVLQVAEAEKVLQASSATSKASLANPYVIALMAVVALGYGIYKVTQYQNDAQKAQSKLNESVKDFTTSTEAEKLELDALFSRLKAAKEGTEEYDSAKTAIFAKYGEQLESLGDEKTALSDIALAYDTITEASLKSARARAMSKVSTDISATTAETVGEAKGKIDSLLKGKFGTKLGKDGKTTLASDYFAEIKLFVDGDSKAVLSKEIQDVIKQFDTAGSYNGTAGGFTGASNALQSQLGDISRVKAIYDKTIADAVVKFGEVQKAPAKADPLLTTYQAQLDAVKAKKVIAEKELAEMKTLDPTKASAAKQKEIKTLATELSQAVDISAKEAIKARLKTAESALQKILSFGLDPSKAITAKQGEVDNYNKLLGEKAAKTKKEEIDREKEITEAMKTASGVKLELLAKELTAIQKVQKAREKLIADAMFDAKNGDINQGDAGMNGILLIGKNGKAVAKTPTAISSKEKPLGLADTRASTEANEKAITKAIDEQKEKAKETAGYFYDIADSASYLSQQIGDSNKELSGMLGVVGNIAGQFGKLAENGFKMSKSEGISSAVSGATQLIGMVIGQAAENKRVMTDYYASIKQQQLEYNLLLNGQLLIGDKIGSSFYIDYADRLKSGTAALWDANKNLDAGMAKFMSNEAIVGKKNVVSGTNVLKGIGSGAALGAGIGSVVPIIGTAVGAVVGAVFGGIVGLFSKKKKDVVAPLLDTYPDLIKANGQFNADLAKTLVANNKITEATKATLNDMISWAGAAETARLQMVGVIDDIVGSVGNDLRGALVTAFEDGADAAAAMGIVMEKVLEDYISNLIFAATIGPELDTLKKDMYASMGLDAEGNVPNVPIPANIADGSFTDDIGRFYGKAIPKIELFNKSVEDSKSVGADYGLDLFGSSTSNNSMQGKISASITENTATELMGTVNRVSLDVREMINMSKSSANHLLNIAANTLRTADNTDQLSQLAEMKASLKSIETASNKTASRL